MLGRTYFAFSDSLNPLHLLDRWLNPAKYSAKVEIEGHTLNITWTQRAQNALEKRSHSLIVEMQLYFSCVVKKRVIFHERYDHETSTVNECLSVAFRTVEPTSCDPVEFAKNYPERRELTSKAANRMHARSLTIDFKKAQWQGEFSI